MGICVVIVFERSFSGGVSTVSEYVSWVYHTSILEVTNLLKSIWFQIESIDPKGQHSSSLDKTWESLFHLPQHYAHHLYTSGNINMQFIDMFKWLTFQSWGCYLHPHMLWEQENGSHMSYTVGVESLELPAFA
jgi:hypothetical protein